MPSIGPCQFPTLGFVVDQYKRVREFVPETFWYIYVTILREDAHEGEKEIVFKWRRVHLFDWHSVFVLYEQCMEQPVARVDRVETKPTSKRYERLSRSFSN